MLRPVEDYTKKAISISQNRKPQASTIKRGRLAKPLLIWRNVIRMQADVKGSCHQNSPKFSSQFDAKIMKVHSPKQKNGLWTNQRKDL